MRFTPLAPHTADTRCGEQYVRRHLASDVRLHCTPLTPIGHKSSKTGHNDDIAPGGAPLKQKGSARIADENKVRSFNEDMGEVLDRLREAEDLLAYFLNDPPETPLPAWAPKLLEQWIVAISGVREDIETRLGLPEDE